MPRKQPARQAESGGSGSGETQQVDTRALRTLAEQLRIIQSDVATAKAQAAEAKADNISLRRQLEQHKQQPKGTVLLKSKGNQAQYDANVAVLNDLIRALTALEEGSEEEIETAIRAAIKQINFRNKLIKLADSSAVGWAFVEEYLRSDLADDEEEDRYIRRCETAAVEKRRLRQEASTRGRGGGGRGRGRAHEQGGQKRQARMEYTEQYPQQGYDQYQHGYQGPQGHQSQGYTAPSQYYQQRQYAAPQHGGSPYQRQLGPCFKCGGPHLVRHCPENDRITSEVQYQIEDDYYQY